MSFFSLSKHLRSCASAGSTPETRKAYVENQSMIPYDIGTQICKGCSQWSMVTSVRSSTYMNTDNLFGNGTFPGYANTTVLKLRDHEIYLMIASLNLVSDKAEYATIYGHSVKVWLGSKPNTKMESYMFPTDGSIICKGIVQVSTESCLAIKDYSFSAGGICYDDDFLICLGGKDTIPFLETEDKLIYVGVFTVQNTETNAIEKLFCWSGPLARNTNFLISEQFASSNYILPLGTPTYPSVFGDITLSSNYVDKCFRLDKAPLIHRNFSTISNYRFVNAMNIKAYENVKGGTYVVDGKKYLLIGKDFAVRY